MKLLRFATVYFFPAPTKWRNGKFSLFDGELELIFIEKDGIKRNRLRLLMKAQINLSKLPELNKDNEIIIPDDSRKRAENVIEQAASMIALSVMGSCQIRTPKPSLALIAENPNELSWLNSTKGLEDSEMKAHPIVNVEIDRDPLLALMKDRSDGVVMLSEANSQFHSVGKYRELVRFFERAFKANFDQLGENLSTFLETSNKGYSKDEIAKWIKFRNPVIHAKKRSDYVTESTIRPIISRMVQAAYDVLFNKGIWFENSPARRNHYEFPTTIYGETDKFEIKTSGPLAIGFKFIDQFGAYPTDEKFELVGYPDEWWTKPINS